MSPMPSATWLQMLIKIKMELVGFEPTSISDLRLSSLSYFSFCLISNVIFAKLLSCASIYYECKRSFNYRFKIKQRLSKILS